ncbi:MAG: uracil phosphoribosyltransferase [Patescibacteria group bacterium]
MLTILNDTPSIITQYLRELRDIEIQKDKQRFERNLELLGVIAGYELSKRLDYTDHETTTPLGKANTPILKDKVVLTTILRAGLPVHHGIHKVLGDIEVSFIAAGRKPETAAGVEIDLAYIAAPSLDNKVLIIADTMLATGKSIVDSYNALTQNHGKPSKVFIVAVIASQQGLDYIQQNLPEAELIVCTVDKELNENYFIVPGLGDAGDILYGPKL